MSYSGYNNFDDSSFSQFREEPWTFEDNVNENVKEPTNIKEEFYF